MSLKVYSFPLFYYYYYRVEQVACLPILYLNLLCFDTECLDASASYLNVGDQEIGRRYEFKSIDTIRSSVKGRLEELCLTGR